MNTIGLDLGTGAVKGVCFNREKGVLKRISERINFNRPGADRIEIEPQQYKEQIFRIIRELAESSEGPVSGISFAAASGNTLLCAPDGTPETPIISWLDKRLPDWRPPEDWQVRRTTGWPAISTFPLMHLEYFRRTRPDLLKSALIAMNNDWLLWQLCGKHLLDSSNAAPFYLWDQTKKCPAPYLSYYGITPEQLPVIVPPGTVAGTLRDELSGTNLTSDTRIVAGSFDHPAGARAVNVLTPGTMLLSCGTSWVGFHPCPAREDVPQKELCDTFQSDSGGCWGAMFSVAAVGVEIENFICQRYGNTSERYEKFNGEALAGDTPARELMNSVIDRFKVRLDEHPAVKRLVMSGGPSEGKGWLALLKEKLPVEIEVSPYYSYTGAVGAAMIAGGLVK